MTEKVTVIEWVDSCSFSNGLWHDIDSVKALKPDPIVSVGFVQREDDACVVLASSISEDCLAGDLCIPRVSITKIRHFPIKPKKRKKSAK